MRSALAAAHLLADSAARSAALLAVADLVDQLARWDTRDAGELGDADATSCELWPMQAATLIAAAGTGFAGPLHDAAVELRAAARAGDPAGRHPQLDDDQVDDDGCRCGHDECGAC